MRLSSQSQRPSKIGLIKKIALILSLVFLLGGIAGTAVTAQSLSKRSTRVTTFSPQKGEKRDFYLVWGEKVEITGEIDGDIYVAAEEVSIEGSVKGDILAAAAKVTIGADVTQDVRVAAGEVVINNGTIGRNVTLLAGQARIEVPAQILGGLAILSGDIIISAPVKGEVKASGGSVVVDAEIDKDAEIWADSLTLTPAAKIGKDLVYYSSSFANVSKEALVSGKISRVTAPQQFSIWDTPQLKGLKDNIRNFRLYVRLLSFSSALIIGLLILRFFPRYASTTSDILRKRLGASLLLGFATFFLAPIALILVSLTIVGIPLAVIFFFKFLIYIYLAKIYVSLWLGRSLFKNLIKNTYLVFILGLALYYLAGMVAFLGAFVWLLTVFLGLGIQILAAKSYYQKLYRAKII